MLRQFGRIYTRLGGATHVAGDVVNRLKYAPRPCQAHSDLILLVVLIIQYIPSDP